MSSSTRRVQTHRHANITSVKAHDRTVKGWETKRRKNKHLKNVTKLEDGLYHWDRPNGEVIPLRGFTDKQVELMAPAFTANDTHLKTDQKLNLEVYATDMKRSPLMKYMIGGYVMHTGHEGADKEHSKLTKKYAQWKYNIPEENWGRVHTLNMNTRHLDNPNPAFHPTGIMIHEIGHVVGPGDMSKWSDKRIKEYENAFQWRARYKDDSKRFFKSNYEQKGKPDRDWIGNGSGYTGNLWAMHEEHPAALSAFSNGQAYTKRPNYGATNIHEDFAETYRNLSGIPIETRSKALDKKSGQIKDQNAHFFWEDHYDDTRKKYMKKYHMKHTAGRPDKYRADLATTGRRK